MSVNPVNYRSAQTVGTPDNTSIRARTAEDGGKQGEADLSSIGNQSRREALPLSIPAADSTHISSTIAGLGSLNASQLMGDLNGLLLLMHQSGVAKAKADKLVRKAEAQASINASNSAAKEIRAAAFQNLMGSIVSGAATIGSAGFQVKNASNNLKAIGELNAPSQATPATTAAPDTASTLKADAFKADAPKRPGDIELTEMKTLESTPNSASEVTANAQLSKSQISPNEGSPLGQKRAGADQQDTAQASNKGTSGSVQDEQQAHSDAKRMKLDGSESQPEPATPTGKEAVQEPEQKKQPTERDIKLRELDQSAARLRALSDIGHGLGSTTNALAQNSAAGHQATKAELEAESKAHDIAMQGAGDAIQTTMEQMRAWRDILQAVSQGNVETSRGIARNI